MNFSLEILTNIYAKGIIEQYETYTYPSFKKKWQVRNLVEPFTLVKASENGKIVGLAVLEIVPESSIGKFMKIVSLFVMPDYRNQQIASKILMEAEKIAYQQGCKHIDMVFQNNWDSFHIIQRLLDSMGWLKAQERMIMCKVGYPKISSTDWYKKVSIPAQVETFKWVSISEQDKKYVQSKQQEGWYKTAISPFQAPDQIEPASSLGIRYQNKVVGWIVNHKISNILFQVSSFFLTPELRSGVYSAAILKNSVEAAHQTGYQFGLFMFDVRNQAIHKFVTKRIIPVAESTTKILLGRKLIRD